MLDIVKRESIYPPEQSGLKFPQTRAFATPALERRHRQERRVAACRAFALGMSPRPEAKKAALTAARSARVAL